MAKKKASTDDELLIMQDLTPKERRELKKMLYGDSS